MEKILTGINNHFKKNRLVFFISLITSFLIAGWIVSHLNFETGIADGLSEGRLVWTPSLLFFLLLLLNYGRIELAVISFIPMLITLLCLLAMMDVFGGRFTIVKILPPVFILGAGSLNSYLITDGILEEYKTGIKKSSSYKLFLSLSVLGAACLGVLIFSGDPALRSIAILSMAGIICSAILSIILIPLFFSFLTKNRTQKKKFPWTISGLFKSVFSFSYFVIGSLVLTLAGFILVRLNPFNKESGKYLYHTLLSNYCWSLMYIMDNVKKRIRNTQKEDFSRPAVIVCNHQSFLDILMTVLLYPKLILFTNHWVWNSPVFGAVVRMADYYPIMQGAEDSMDLLADRINQGYSVVVFPEGTRSVDGTMKRFHKGAFYIAEKLQLDILPIVIHGSGYTMGKSDFLLKDGTITLQFLPRIKPGDTTFGTGYAEKAKLMGRYFREQFIQLKTEIEQPAYFREQLIYNYIYKGPVLEWYLRVKLSIEKNYRLFNELLPLQGKLLDIGCGYGFMSYLLHFVSPLREITGIDYDREKIGVANHCFSKNERINFICADATDYPLEKYDGIVLSDILHYLQPGQQRKLIEKCIDNLNPGGTMLIREGNRDLAEKHRGTRLTEFFSTRFFNFNKTTAHGLSFLSAQSIRQIAAAKKMDCTEMDDSRHTSNMIFVIKHNHEHRDKKF